ncbi:MAG: inorganic phosphate transporter [Candidatus Verstraetearchaeota archaeon]|nr:inorganic phosphate transporter [Candidatus Verstraetearchaeota archaeon]
MDVQFILLIIGLILAFIMAMNLGGNDAANPTSTTVGTGILSLRRALLLFAIFATAGAALQGFMVMTTIGRGIVPAIDVAGAVAIMLAANIWIFTATLRGMAISTTHSIIGAVVGYGILKYMLSGMNLSVLGTVVLSWITSPLCSLVLAFLVYKWIKSYVSKYTGKPETIDRFFKVLLIGSLCLAAYSFGANDVANATGVYITIASDLGRMPDTTAMLVLALFGAAGIIAGGLMFGPRVIETLAFKVTHLDLNTALSASISNALVVYIFTTVPYMLWGYGLPVSTSYAVVGSIIGAGLARNVRSVSRAVSVKLVSYWLLTIPINILLAMGIYYAFMLLNWTA